jgi:hypothetical protein
MKNIIKNATIVYKNGIKKICDTISITEMGIYVGRLESKKEVNQNFVNYVFIPKNQIQKVIFFDKDGNSKAIDFKKQIREEEKK